MTSTTRKQLFLSLRSLPSSHAVHNSIALECTFPPGHATFELPREVFWLERLLPNPCIRFLRYRCRKLSDLPDCNTKKRLFLSPRPLPSSHAIYNTIALDCILPPRQAPVELPRRSLLQVRAGISGSRYPLVKMSMLRFLFLASLFSTSDMLSEINAQAMSEYKTASKYLRAFEQV